MTHMAVMISDGGPLTDGGHDLDNYLFPLAQRLGPPRQGGHLRPQDPRASSLAVGPPQPDTAKVSPLSQETPGIAESSASPVSI